MNILNLYGSTEAMPIGVECINQSGLFHLIPDSLFTYVRTADNRVAAPGERGDVIVSRIGWHVGHVFVPSYSSSIINYANGDSAMFLDEKCTCGYEGPSLGAIERSEPALNRADQSGCQVWE